MAKLLVIAPSPTLRGAIATLLSRDGHTVAGIDDGVAALCAVAEQCPDLLLMDCALPRLDGYEVCTLLKAHPRYAGLPVVLMSPRDSAFARERAGLCGAEGWLPRPFGEDELRFTVRERLRA